MISFFFFFKFLNFFSSSLTTGGGETPGVGAMTKVRKESSSFFLPNDKQLP